MNPPIELPSTFLTRLEDDSVTAAVISQDCPRVSIVMPSFQQSEYIERSILSVLNQGYANLEFIIIDGGSTDSSVDIIKKYEKFLAHWVSESDQGQSDALNKGFALATGEIYGWLNSDDIYLPGALKKAVSALDENPGKKIVFGDWLSIDSSDEIVARNYAFDFNLNHFKYEGFHLNSQAMFWRRQAHENFGMFDLSLHRTMDYQMIMAFGVNEGERSFIRLQDPLACFRRHELQKTTGEANSGIVLAEHRRIAERYGYMDKYAFPGKLKRLLYRARRARWYFKRGGANYLYQSMLGSQRGEQ